MISCANNFVRNVFLFHLSLLDRINSIIGIFFTFLPFIMKGRNLNLTSVERKVSIGQGACICDVAAVEF